MSYPPFQPDQHRKAARELAPLHFRMIEVFGLSSGGFGQWPFFCHQCGAGFPPTARFCSAAARPALFAHPMPGRPLCGPIGRQIAGVCIALTQANGWDVAVVRILTVLGFFFSGGFVGIAYLAGWIGIPEEPFLLPALSSGAYPPNPATNPPIRSLSPQRMNVLALGRSTPRVQRHRFRPAGRLPPSNSPRSGLLAVSIWLDRNSGRPRHRSRPRGHGAPNSAHRCLLAAFTRVPERPSSPWRSC